MGKKGSKKTLLSLEEQIEQLESGLALVKGLSFCEEVLYQELMKKKHGLKQHKQMEAVLEGFITSSR